MEVREIVKAAGIRHVPTVSDEQPPWGTRLAALIEMYGNSRINHRSMPKAADVRVQLERINHALTDLIPPLARVTGNLGTEITSVALDAAPWPEALRLAVGNILHDDSPDALSQFEVLLHLMKMQTTCETWIAMLSAGDGGGEGDPYFDQLFVPRMLSLWREAGGRGAPSSNKGGIYGGGCLDFIEAALAILHRRDPAQFPPKARGTIHKSIQHAKTELSESRIS